MSLNSLPYGLSGDTGWFVSLVVLFMEGTICWGLVMGAGWYRFMKITTTITKIRRHVSMITLFLRFDGLLFFLGNFMQDNGIWYRITLWLTGARKEAKPTEARPVEPRVRPDRVRCRA